jgi:signal transduction histidine kinase
MVWREARRWLLAVLTVAIAVAVARALDPYVAPHVSPPYFLAVMLVAVYAGAGPGLLATALASMAIAWFDLGSTGNFDLGLDDLLRLAVFSTTAVMISSISAARQKAENQLRVALDELASADRAKDEFIATISHELRTPLTSILGWSKILRDRDLDPETREIALESIEQSARTQAMLVNDMLDVSRIVLGKMQIERVPLLLHEIVRAAVDIVRPFAQAKKIAIDLVVGDGGQTAIIEGDPERIKQVVWNFLTNAVKFTPEGGHVRVRVAQERHDALVEVVDNGEGIDAELLPHVFDRFLQGRDGTRKGGLGLGLAIARHIVELHGGQVSAHSRGRGSTFTARFPSTRRSPAQSFAPKLD